MENRFPSRLLVEAWIELAHLNRSPDTQCSVIDKINATFGSILAAELYIEMEKLKGRK
ncbi:MAG: hypothetical protein HRU23_18620 [Gammaproteobacteria bacterium]|nr:hypothetical protein [Gammaproteobacteria bacterium]